MSDPDKAAVPPRRHLASPFRVGDWLAEPAWNRIARGGETVKLEPRVMRLLATLAAAPGRPLLREDLLDAVWPETTVNEEALSRAVSQLRRALGDDPKAPRYLQTVHKGGYCLIAPVGEAAAPAARATGRSPVRWVVWAVLALVIVAAGAWLYRMQGPAPRAAALRELVPLTSEPGREIDPAISPDGRRVAYLASVGADYDLFVRDLAGGAPLRVTRNSLAKGHPVWSPDGERIAFVATGGGATAIYAVPATGGEVRKLADLASWSFGLDWSPDGGRLAFADAAPGEVARIAILDIRSGAVRPVTDGGSSAGDVKPAFSPDGERIAFIRNDQSGRQRLAVVEVQAGGEAALLAAPPQQLRGLDWAPDGRSLIVSAKAGRRFGLWRVPVAGGGAPEALPTEGGDLFNPSVSRGGRVVIEEVEQDRDVWQAYLATMRAAPLVRSTSDDTDPAFAPDGKALAFVSERSGAPELWIQSGQNARRLTGLRGRQIRNLTWSPDGARIAFAAEAGGGSAIYVAAARGGDPVRLPGSAESELPIGWSRGGEILFTLSPAGRHWRIQAVDPTTGGRRSVTRLAVRAAALAADNGSIFAVPADQTMLVQIVPGQGAVRQWRLPALAHLAALVPSAGSVYLVEDALGTAAVHRLDLRSGAFSTEGELDHYGGGALSLRPDGRAIAYTRARETANDLAWLRL